MKWTKTQRIEALEREAAIEEQVLERYPYLDEEQKCSTTKMFRDLMRKEYREKLEKNIAEMLRV